MAEHLTKDDLIHRLMEQSYPSGQIFFSIPFRQKSNVQYINSLLKFFLDCSWTAPSTRGYWTHLFFIVDAEDLKNNPESDIHVERFKEQMWKYDSYKVKA